MHIRSENQTITPPTAILGVCTNISNGAAVLPKDTFRWLYSLSEDILVIFYIGICTFIIMVFLVVPATYTVLGLHPVSNLVFVL